MIVKAEKQRLKKLLSDAIPLLCKNGIEFQSAFRVEAMIGITVDDNEVVLVCFKETITSDGSLVQQVYGMDDDSENAATETPKNKQPELRSPSTNRRKKQDVNDKTNICDDETGDDDFHNSVNYTDDYEQYDSNVQMFHNDQPFAKRSRSAATAMSEQVNSDEHFNLSSADTEQYSDDIGQTSERHGHQRSGSTSSASQQFQIKAEAADEDEEDDCMFVKAEQQDLDMYVAQAATSEMLQEASGFDGTVALQPVAATTRKRFRPAGYPVNYHHQRGGIRQTQQLQQYDDWQQAGNSLATVGQPFGSRKRGGSNSLPATPKAKGVRTLAQFGNADGRSQEYQCEDCDSRYRDSTGLKRHLLVHHRKWYRGKYTPAELMLEGDWMVELAKERARQSGLNRTLR